MLVAEAPNKAGANRRVLGIEPAAVGFAVLALLITAGILLVQMRVRTGEFEPEAMPIFWRLFAFEDYPAAFLFIVALLVAAVPACQRAAARLADVIGEHPLYASIASGAVFAIGSLYVYHAHPLAMDESAPYMQSKIFAHGALVGRLPVDLIDWLVVPNFQNYFIYVSHQTGEVASSYWPGFALLLTPFMWAGVPWLCNPVLGAAAVWVIHRLTFRITDSKQAAGAAALFALGSAAFTINSISFYSMTAHLLCNAVFALLLTTPSPRRCALAGLVGGLALTLHNPVPHLLFAPPWALWVLTQKNRWALIGSLLAGYLPWIVCIGFGWAYLLRSFADAATTASAAQDNGKDLVAQALSQVGSVLKIPTSVQLFARLAATAKLWLWASPLLLLAAGFGFWRHRRNTHMKLLLASAVLTFIAYLFVPLDQGHGWGYRYFHSAWFVLPVFAAAALVAPRAAATKESEQTSSKPLGRWALAGTLGGLLIMTPYFSYCVHSFIGSHLAQLPTADHGTPRVVIISTNQGYYVSDLVQNDPFLAGQVIRMYSHGRVNDEDMMAHRFPELVPLRKSQKGSVWGTP